MPADPAPPTVGRPAAEDELRQVLAEMFPLADLDWVLAQLASAPRLSTAEWAGILLPHAQDVA